MDGKPRVIKVAKIPAKSAGKQDPLTTCIDLCYYYPAYTLAEARRLPAPHVRRMLKRARQLEAQRYLELVQIASAPNTKDGQGVRELIRKYQEIASNE